MKRDAWKPRRAAEREYEDVLTYLLQQLEKLPLRALSTAKYSTAYAKQAALRMITGLYFEGAKTWREAARESGKTRLMYVALQRELRGPVGARFRQLVNENAALISSFPTTVARRVASAAAAHSLAGGRAEGIVGMLPGVARSRARLIARTEVSKASTALTRARSEEMGLEWYVWESSQDERTRRSHRKMQGILCRFDNPPDPEVLAGEKSQGHYNAGDIYNCRCYPAPLVSEREVSWPHRAYYNGRIQYLTLSQFRLINQGERKAA